MLSPARMILMQKVTSNGDTTLRLYCGENFVLRRKSENYPRKLFNFRMALLLWWSSSARLLRYYVNLKQIVLAAPENNKNESSILLVDPFSGSHFCSTGWVELRKTGAPHLGGWGSDDDSGVTGGGWKPPATQRNVYMRSNVFVLPCANQPFLLYLFMCGESAW